MFFNKTSCEHAYFSLESIIKSRQGFEALHPYPPYSTYPTDLNYRDIHGNTLLHYAASMGDFDKVKTCIARGASLDLLTQDSNHYSAVNLALENNHLDIAKFLYLKVASFSKTHLFMCKNEEAKKWFMKILKDALDEICANPKASIEIKKENQFFKQTSDSQELLCRAAELGDISFLEAFTSVHPEKFDAAFNVTEKNFTTPIIAAAENGQLAVITFLIANGIALNSDKPFTDTPLHAAIMREQTALCEFLLEMNGDVNQQNNIKRTPLMHAVLVDNVQILKKLLKKEADLSIKDIQGQTVMHYCAESENKEVVDYLLSIPSARNLLSLCDIYGQSPIDIAIQNKNEFFLNSVKQSVELENIKNSKQYGKKPPSINQNILMKKMHYYLKSQYRDTRYFNMGGNCNGLSFIEGHYAGRGLLEYYFNTLTLIANWDGQEATLSEPFLAIQQAKYYKNLAELLDQWANDVIWFQHYPLNDVTSIRQEDRLKQYQAVADNPNYEYFPLYDEITYLAPSRTIEQIKEILVYLYKLPTGSHFEIGGEGHATAGHINKSNNISYYDPNFKLKTCEVNGIESLLNLILDFKYILLGRFSKKLTLSLNIFCFQKEKLQTENFEIFSENEICKNHVDAKKFQDNSPNRFTQLHIAVITRSLPVIKRLLELNCCDYNAKDALERTALSIAVENNYQEAVNLLINSNADIDFEHCKEIKLFYQKGWHNLVQAVINKPSAKNMYDLFYEAIKNSDLSLVKILIQQQKVDVNHADGRLPLISALQQGDREIVNCLLAHNANILASDKNFFSTDTPLAYVIRTSSKFYSTIIEKLIDVNACDQERKRAINYAVLYSNIEAINDLTKRGAEIFIKNPWQNIYDLILSSKPEVFEELILNYNWELTNPEHNERLLSLLSNSLNKNDAMFNMLLQKANLNILNTALENGYTLLHKAIIEQHLVKINLLLQRDVNINAVTERGNTPLHIFILLKDYPDRNKFIEKFLNNHADYNP